MSDLNGSHAHTDDARHMPLRINDVQKTTFNTPRTLKSLKTRAKQLAKSSDLTRTKALEIVSQDMGFPGYQKAQRTLPETLPLVTVTAKWKRADTGLVDYEQLTYPMTKSVRELLAGAPRKTTLGSFKLLDDYQLVDTVMLESRSQARLRACQTLSKLLMMEATGLVPVALKDAFWPYDSEDTTKGPGRRRDQMPGSDHVAAWKYPDAVDVLITNEPYLDSHERHEHSVHQMAWADRHGFDLKACRWKGFYNPTGGTRLTLIAKRDGRYDLDSLEDQLAKLPDDFGHEPGTWRGVTVFKAPKRQ